MPQGVVHVELKEKTKQMISTAVEEAGSLRNSLEVARSVSDKHLDLLRPSARYYSVSKGQAPDAAEKGKYTLIKDAEDFQTGIFDKPLPCFGCGIGWFSFLLGFVCPLMWYYATFLYFGNHYRKDPRERAGLAASAISELHANQVLSAWAKMEETVAPTSMQYERRSQLVPYAEHLCKE
ncbi:hypothetical protein CRYUN_Cryun33cG0068800 [Craigia yunnanensis]